MLAVDRGPGRTVLRWLYESVGRVYASYVRRIAPGAAAYLRGTVASGEALFGLSDVDLGFILPPDPTGAARRRIRDGYERASRRLPLLGRVIEPPVIYEESRFVEAIRESALTYGLENGRASQFGPMSEIDRMQLERTELYGDAGAWRLLCGPDRRPAEQPERDPWTRHHGTWLELQNWWRHAFIACAEPEQFENAYLCVKLIAEVARIWLWMTRGERVADRAHALARASVELPAESETFARARRLQGSLRAMPSVPLADFLGAFARLSTCIAGELTRQVAPAGTSEVRLLSSPEAGLALPHGGLPATWVEAWPGARLFALCDWRALAAPIEPDETHALVPGDPGDPEIVGAIAATATEPGPYLTLFAGGLMVRPTKGWGRSRLRAVQCEVTDPVSFALSRGASVAPFANVRGFSVQDTARRAVAEHAAWLRTSPSEHPGTTLGRLVTAARAGLLWQTISDGAPELALTVDATLAQLGARADAESLADEIRGAYHDFAASWNPPPTRLANALRTVVLSLPAFDRLQPAPEPSC
jgi:hypothetical protein